MCFDHDSRPPILPIAGGALDSRELTLTAADGNRLTAFEARAVAPCGATPPAEPVAEPVSDRVGTAERALRRAGRASRASAQPQQHAAE